MPPHWAIAAVCRVKFVGFAQKPATEGRFLYWRGHGDRLISGFGTLRSRSFGYWMAQNVYLHEMRAYIRAGELGLVLRPV